MWSTLVPGAGTWARSIFRRTKWHGSSRNPRGTTTRNDVNRVYPKFKRRERHCAGSDGKEKSKMGVLGRPWPPCASMDAPPSPPCRDPRPIPPTFRRRPNTSSKTLNPSLPTRGDENDNDSFDARNGCSNSGSSDRGAPAAPTTHPPGFTLPDRGAHRTMEARRRILPQSSSQRLIQPACPVSDAGVARSRVPTCLFLNRARPTIEAAMARRPVSPAANPGTRKMLIKHLPW
jgi:hypothetical protein